MAKKDSTTALARPAPAGQLGRIQPARAAEGFENVGRDDLIVPRLAICQAMSPERNKKNADKYIEGLREGELFHNLRKERLGTKLRIAVIHFFKSRVKFTGDIGEGIDCRAGDGRHGVPSTGDKAVRAAIPKDGDCARCPFAQWHDEEGPECTAYYNFVVVAMPDRGFPLVDDMMVMSFKSTGVTAAKQWISRMKFMTDDNKQPLPIFGGVHDLTVREQSNDKHSWFQFHVEPAGQASPEQREYARAIYLMVKDADAAGRLKAEDDLSPRGDDATAREPGDEGPHDRREPF